MRLNDFEKKKKLFIATSLRFQDKYYTEFDEIIKASGINGCNITFMYELDWLFSAPVFKFRPSFPLSLQEEFRSLYRFEMGVQ